MKNLVLTHLQISPRLKQALNLPPDAWQLVINGQFTVASFMDGRGFVHHVDIDELAREQVKRATKQLQIDTAPPI